MRVRLGRQLDLGLFRGLRLAGPGGERLIVAVNYAPNQSQCHVRLPFAGACGRQWQLTDRLGGTTYVRDGDELYGRGLYLDESPWSARIFELTSV